MITKQSLLDLVPSHFLPLNPLEEEMIRLATLDPNDISDLEFDEGVDLSQYGENKVVRSDLLVWLLTDPDCHPLIHHKGISLHNAQITGNLDLQDSNVGFPLRLRACQIDDGMTLDRGSYHLLDFTGSTTGPIEAVTIHVKHDLLMSDGFYAQGEVCLLGAIIGGNLECNGGTFDNPGGDAFSGDTLTVAGTIIMGDGFRAIGTVRLLGANIGSNLECDGGIFENPGKDSLIMDNFSAKGSVFLRVVEKEDEDENHAGGVFEARGNVFLRGADIGGDLDCTKAKFEGDFFGNGMTVRGTFFWRQLTGEMKWNLLLENAKLAHLCDYEDSWPETGKLSIGGLTYESLSSNVEENFRTRLRWLKLQDPKRPNIQPYEQLSNYFRKIGLRNDAREVAIEREKHIRKDQSGLPKLWSRILDKLISFGYKPEKILPFMLLAIVVGSVLFFIAFRIGVLEPTPNHAQMFGMNSKFNPIGYSLDVFLPIVDLHQESAWEININKIWGVYFQIYLFTHIAFGWLFTTLFVAAATGLVKSD
ncbi:MAG: hypothetical protein MUC85_03625 [Anaerolineales bacterium]|jgi:hypothetical protein|nr:hypothetical protein [Anaerolineales bacterium]